MAQQLIEAKGQLMMKETECSQMGEQLNILRNEINLMKQDHSLLRQQLNEKEVHVQTLSLQTSSLESGSHMVRTKI